MFKKKKVIRDGSGGRGGGGTVGGSHPPPTRDEFGFLIPTVFCKKEKTLWFIGVEVIHETR